jgi:TPP-dependent pyruvate/acetoin dehydrogenase alpha subunit
MVLIRCFEERVLGLFSKGIFMGTTHCCIGQEANAVGVISALEENDTIFSNHRCHGHFLAYSNNPEALLAELMGKETGVCSGRGGSQHLCWKNFYSNGILGGTVGCAVGMAMAEKLKESSNIVVAFMGDGTLGEGIVYEALNIASIWDIPVLFILENNHYAQSTPMKNVFAGSIEHRIRGFGISCHVLKTTDVRKIYDHLKKISAWMRKNRRPFFQVIDTYRFCPHSKSDDFRPKDEISRFRKFDPLIIHGRRIGKEERDKIYNDCMERIDKAFNFAEKSGFPCELGWKR